MDLDEDEPAPMEDSLSGPPKDTTINLVNQMTRETGATRPTRQARSPSPTGSVSSCEDIASPPKKRAKPVTSARGGSSQSNNVAMAAITALQQIAGLTKSKGSSHPYEDDDDEDEEVIKPTLVHWTKYEVKDNGQTILDMKLRNALKTINAKPSKYFKYYDRQIKPALETMQIAHLRFNSVNPRITKKMYDCAAFLELKYFDPGNISLTSKPPSLLGLETFLEN